MEEVFQPDGKILEKMVNTKMPFGKYKDSYLQDLPVSYLEWFQKEGWPDNELGIMMNTVYEMKLNGLQSLLMELSQRYRNR